MDKILWNLSESIDKKIELFKIYHNNSKHSSRTQSYNSPRIMINPKYELDENEEVVIQIPYLEDREKKNYSLYEALLNRRTSWNYSKEYISDDEIIDFIAYSFGISNKTQNLKTYPSGGRFFPVDIYIIPTENLVKKSKIFSENRVYKYNVHTRNLLVLNEVCLEDIDTLTSATDIGDMSFKGGKFLICLVGNYEYIIEKYHSLSYRLIYSELGHIGQNIMLVSTMLGLASVPLGGFFEDRINKFLGIKSKYKSNMYTFIVG